MFYLCWFESWTCKYSLVFMGLLKATKDNSSLAASEDITLPNPQWEAHPKTKQLGFVSKHCRRPTHSSKEWEDNRQRPKLSSLLLSLVKWLYNNTVYTIYIGQKKYFPHFFMCYSSMQKLQQKWETNYSSSVAVNSVTAWIRPWIAGQLVN